MKKGSKEERKKGRKEEITNGRKEEWTIGKETRKGRKEDRSDTTEHTQKKKTEISK